VSLLTQGAIVSPGFRFSRIVGGKLYPNYDSSIREKWAKDAEGYIREAGANWS
jgi:hypothetical protein